MMKTLLFVGFLSVVGFVAYQQWDVHQRSGRPAVSPSGDLSSAKESKACSGPVTIGSRLYPEAELRGLFARVRDGYVMQDGVCYHRWQSPSSSPITYPDFVHHFKNGYAFVELSEPGQGETIVLETKSIRRVVKKAKNP